jgi:phosphatidylethanolamine/phosphatidyl-N-methylethanolamine N-methyltransferase
MKENIQFLQAFLKHPLTVGSIAPSSPELAKAMMHGVEANEDNIVIELGVGTGAITKFIEQRIPDNKSYLGIEVDKELVDSLHQRFDDLNIICGSACETHAIHKESGLGKAGYILCCLPFVTLPAEVGKRVLAEIEKFMDEGCTFRTFQYAHGYYTPAAIKLREFMRKRYGKSKRSPLVVKNVPPAYTLTWSTA